MKLRLALAEKLMDVRVRDRLVAEGKIGFSLAVQKLLDPMLSNKAIDPVVLANELNLIANEVIINASNAHIYEEHIDAALVYTERKKNELPKLLNASTFSNFKADELKISEYKCNERIIVNVIK